LYEERTYLGGNDHRGPTISVDNVRVKKRKKRTGDKSQQY
jgi:hypothetical protein